MVNMPQRPPILRGRILKVNFFKIMHYERYLVLDPESGALARYKKEDDAPLNPCDLIPLEHIEDIRISKGKWFQDEKLIYLEISYFDKKVYLALKHKSAARQWFDALRNSVGYVKYVNNKIQQYTAQNNKKAHKSIVQIMMQQANQNILITDEDIVDSKSHIKQKLQKCQDEYNATNKLNSVSEVSEEDRSVIIERQVNSEYLHHQHTSEEKFLFIKDFEILELIGKGSFGNVYKARCKLNGKIYALKQQEKDKMISTNHIQYVLGEQKILKQLHHPFLVHLHFAFQTPYHLYLALDYCGKGDLSKYMTRGVVLDELTSKFFIAQIILAVEYLHDKNILYRDLKPENIIIDDEGYIKLIDFGLSKEGKQQEDFVAKSFCGSPAYLSPEIVSAMGTTKATDVYTIGTILFEMLTGYPPYYTTNIKQLLHNIKYQKLSFPPTVSKEGQNILHKMLDKDPQNRITLSQLKKHLFFADINFDKLLTKKYIPPKLKERVSLPPNSNFSDQQQQRELIDYTDYESPQHRLTEIPGWNYGY